MKTAPPIRVLLVDDEPLARSSLRHLLEAEADMAIVGESGNGLDAVDAIQADRPDLVFLDIQMPELDGFGVLELLEPPKPALVFVTAYDQYALKAFDANAVDYLLKPFSNERFGQALAKARHQVRTGGMDYTGLNRLTASNRRYHHRFIVKAGGRVLFLRAAEIDWIEANDYYACLHVGERSYLIRESMNDLEAGLDPEAFARVHRSAIVNLQQVKEILVPAGGELSVLLRCGALVRLSRGKRESLTQSMAARG
jgi:two-component system LytT family response regulator